MWYASRNGRNTKCASSRSASLNSRRTSAALAEVGCLFHRPISRTSSARSFSNCARAENKNSNFSNSRRLSASSRTVAGRTEPSAEISRFLRGQQCRLGDGAIDQDVDGGIAVERRDQVLVRADAPDGFGARVVDAHHARGDELVQRPPDRGAIRQVRGTGHRPVPCRDVAGQRLHGGQHLADGQRPVRTQQREADHRGGRDRRGTVDPVLDVQCDAFDLRSRCRIRRPATPRGACAAAAVRRSPGRRDRAARPADARAGSGSEGLRAVSRHRRLRSSWLPPRAAGRTRWRSAPNTLRDRRFRRRRR